MKPMLGLILYLASLAASSADEVRVVCPKNATPRERLAAAEIVRYVYLRTGQLPVIGSADGDGEAIVLARDTAKLGPQQFELRSDGKRIVITGGDDLGVLYGAYRFAEKIGVRFYLHGDVVPDGHVSLAAAWNADANAKNNAAENDNDRCSFRRHCENGKPLFGLRGLNPWGSHPFGFDAWGTDDYKAVFTQLTKLRMNFLGIHCYPEGHPYAEPTVWLGTRGDFDKQGRVKASYPSHYYNTLVKGIWGPLLPKKTATTASAGRCCSRTTRGRRR